MRERGFVAVILGSILLLTTGCGCLYYLNESDEHKAFRKNGYELCHIRSCGPDALEDAFVYFDINKTSEEIGKEIQDADHVHYRDILSIVNHEFSEITCPPELLKYVKSNGFDVHVTLDIYTLRSDQVAIVLLRGKNDLRDWHYMTYPTHTKHAIERFFDTDTKILKAYILTKK